MCYIGQCEQKSGCSLYNYNYNQCAVIFYDNFKDYYCILYLVYLNDHNRIWYVFSKLGLRMME